MARFFVVAIFVIVAAQLQMSWAQTLNASNNSKRSPAAEPRTNSAAHELLNKAANAVAQASPERLLLDVNNSGGLFRFLGLQRFFPFYDMTSSPSTFEGYLGDGFKTATMLGTKIFKLPINVIKCIGQAIWKCFFALPLKIILHPQQTLEQLIKPAVRFMVNE